MKINIEEINDIAKKAGHKIMSIYSGNIDVSKKPDDSPLTIADQLSHESIVTDLKRFGLPIISEEGKNISFLDRQKWHRYWLVDPLDGTKEFIKKNGMFTVNIALIESGKPILGVIYIPDSNELFYASKAEGAYKQSNGIRKQLLIQKPIINKLTAVVSASHPSNELAGFS